MMPQQHPVDRRRRRDDLIAAALQNIEEIATSGPLNPEPLLAIEYRVRQALTDLANMGAAT